MSVLDLHVASWIAQQSLRECEAANVRPAAPELASGHEQAACLPNSIPKQACFF
jgi:hypothetical protein